MAIGGDMEGNLYCLFFSSALLKLELELALVLLLLLELELELLRVEIRLRFDGGSILFVLSSRNQ